MTLKSLPLAYDRDLQATKRSLETLFELPFAFAATAGMIRAMEFDVVRLREAASDEALLATDLAEALVERGVPFRTAHERVASVARRAEELGVSFRSALSDSAGVIVPLELREAEALLDPDASVRRRSTPGGPSPSSVRAQVRHLRVASRRSRGRLEMLAASLPERLR
jgi:argininosuccinate lyase